MDRAYIRSLSAAHSDRILQSLSRQQHLHPHQTMESALQEAAKAVGFCRGAAEQAMHWLGVQPDRSIGRLRRTELVQLARSIERFWQRDLAGSVAESTSA